MAQTDKLSHKQVKDMVKHDAFQEGALETVDYIKEHKSDVLKYVVAGLAVLVLIAGIFGYRSYQHSVRQEKLQELLHIHAATVTDGQAPPSAIKVYKTDAEKDAVIRSEFAKFISEYKGSDEAAMISYYLGVNYAEGGNQAEGEKYLKLAIDEGSAAYASVARLALAQVYYSQGKVDDAVKLVDPLIAKPSQLVSKEQATIEKAKLLAKSNPAEARKLLEPLRTSRAAVSQAALGLLSDIK